ncbi:hypothetical protein [Tenacibaculum maritimum]|uniref:Putative lipoprotein n=1 Tax=Tenacibaculum maritimum NCIMB 2154 TaxID=1349785 RepID=A0A2H1EC57_9FLAO|nr:hypothetical protein [Tenacibaculum maritimum]CAA0146624.1 putative lipoprotein precursor [Tenacibaculum maritimum]CAA0146658.1 putative lipoprotein precursor [Tenacibaculum maritimum]CAA0181752.1 putative lipoprotein precursor [Tenacibaculum maritimum]CAA0215022.1 putative lipoprotein precursor [Tenacibaculum maritimum]SFZ84170.1 putative lipoprotein precursor [Tenacibaculum maritimum NCIMB 2154]
MKKILIAILWVSAITSCTNEPILTEESLRNELGFEQQVLSSELSTKIAENTPEIHFKSIEEAKQFLSGIENFSETNVNFYDELNGLLLRGKLINNSRNLKLNSSELQMRCPPPVFQEFIPCEENGDGGCGNGNIMLSTGNMSFNLQLNVGFNYNSNSSGTSASNLNSHMSGFTLGLSYDHISSSHNVSGNTINFTVNGVINYNIFVEGIGTVYKQNVRLQGSYNPCTGSGSIRRTGPLPILN